IRFPISTPSWQRRSTDAMTWRARETTWRTRPRASSISETRNCPTFDSRRRIAAAGSADRSCCAAACSRASSRGAPTRGLAACAGAALAVERSRDEQRRYEAGLSTSFLVTQAQRDLLQAQVSLLQAMLDYQSSLVNFEALQLAPPLTAGESIALQGSNVVPL